jgi:hypothetical protein
MAKFSKKYTYTQNKKCINPQCKNLFPVRMIGDIDSKDYNLPIPTDRRKLACSRECHKYWQKSISWEERVGTDFATEFRKKMSILSSENNPSTFPGVAEKISNSMKRYLAENPQARLAENNGFYGHKHTDKTIEHWKNTKSGKWAYNTAQKEKQIKNTPKKELHPNWLGGISNGEYGLEFNKILKNKVKDAYNNTCQLCNTETTMLDIHHIDYDKRNNLIENLIPLCKVCHGKTNYNRKIWQNILTKK